MYIHHVHCSSFIIPPAPTGGVFNARPRGRCDETKKPFSGRTGEKGKGCRKTIASRSPAATNVEYMQILRLSVPELGVYLPLKQGYIHFLCIQRELLMQHPNLNGIRQRYVGIIPAVIPVYQCKNLWSNQVFKL